jgi:hypothetical protein
VPKAPVAPGLPPRRLCDVDLGFEAAALVEESVVGVGTRCRLAVWNGLVWLGTDARRFLVNIKSRRPRRNSKQRGCRDQMDEYSITGSVNACPFGEVIVKVLGRI